MYAKYDRSSLHCVSTHLSLVQCNTAGWETLLQQQRAKHGLEPDDVSLQMEYLGIMLKDSFTADEQYILTVEGMDYGGQLELKSNWVSEAVST